MFYKGDDDRGQKRPGTGNSAIYNNSSQNLTDDLDDLDDIPLPGAMINEESIIQQKFQRLRLDAQRNTPSSRGNAGLISSSGKTPLSARGLGPSLSRPTSAIGSRPITSMYDSPRGSDKAGHITILDDDMEEIPEQKSRNVPVLPATRSEIGSPYTPRSITSPLSPGRSIKEYLSGDMKEFVQRPAARELGFVKCCITRDKSGLNRMFPRYYLWAEEGDTFLLSAKKRKKNTTSNYAISTSRDELGLGKSSRDIVGKLRSNFVGTEFFLFDTGDNPTKLSSSIDPNAKSRTQLGSIQYETNILGSKGPRKLTVAVPQVDENGDYQQFKQIDDKPALSEKLKINDWKGLCILKNKTPVWNEKLKAFVLNFNGRVTKASVKNFQLAEPENMNKVFLQFGKVDQNKFTLDYRHPLSAIQAFSIAISAFDSKLACE
ncbi:tubby-like protein [Acrasis kona]|uniref:Tubby-like protein n=1 Tax=Acrasis kona TaxID=1008807 RepID=A0AAW2ZKS5_9EUKA